MSVHSPQSRVVGLVPWLPWPLSAWRWWTEPVRAERLAALRIGLAGFLLVDVLLTYLPGVFTFFGQGTLGDSGIYAWRALAPRLSWSLLRGVGDPLFSFLAMATWAITTMWILSDLGTRALQGCGPRERDPLRHSLPLWAVAGTLFVLGIWSRLAGKEGELVYAWIAPLVLVILSWSFVMLELVRYVRSDSGVDRRTLFLLALNWLGAILLLGAGVYLAWMEEIDAGSIWSRVFSPWHDDPVLLGGAMVVWAVATFLLLIGLWTRPAAVATWVLSLSFANLNSSIDNAGDTIRGIILFYLMLCPCGAVWSVDRWWRRRRGKDAPVLYVSPWPIRLLFVQLVFIYFCNGVYKLSGDSWRGGYSLFYVMGDFTLTRFSQGDNLLPLWAMRLMTWSVLIWEVSFPVLVLHRWSRVVTLCFGVLFHLGILFSMELGFFVPYALCLYLPLLPWERWVGRHSANSETETDVEEVGRGENDGAAANAQAAEAGSRREFS